MSGWTCTGMHFRTVPLRILFIYIHKKEVLFSAYPPPMYYRRAHEREDTVMKRTKKQAGFSLIELLIVVAIILVIAAMAIPNLLKARMSANESSAVGSIKAINSAEVTLMIMYPASGYTCTLSHLGPPPTGQLPNRNT